ncbi:adenylosuccinate lyase [Poritiphilus flavus]|uniref:Adenylosuccinate lyase n=1 Tax=Poritiphilus flavus TaxID=2697053 RepID=A0A6L9EAE2_9FLAO|nr:adenylosuccinate lyase [Poritiphilus flavus]NAS11706.1 adenylosuccinate lyase [Poritiphilus flavus]
MTKERLYEALNYVDATREKRGKMAKRVLSSPELIPLLIEIAQMNDDPVSCKASWILEFTLKSRIQQLLPHIDLFLGGLDKVQLDSSVRPMSKLCESLVLAYYSRKKHPAREALSEGHLEQIATACFDWLIGEHKVAAKAYAMTSLYHLGNQFAWIHPELRLVLEQNYASGSAAYKARARQVLEKLGGRSRQ